jgi:superfamily II DNA or RNA helicase
VSLELRDYQREAITDVRARFQQGARRVPLVLATGLGKTVIFTHPLMLDDYLNAGKRVLIIAHTDELIDQAARKARAANPGRRVGIVKAGLNEVHAQIIVSSRQTLGHATGGPRRLASIRNVGLIVVDEAHHAVRTNTYGKILEHFGAFHEDPNSLCVPDDHPHVTGWTATLARGDKMKLSSVWEECTFRRDILFGIRRGYLLDVTGKRVVVPDLDMRNVKQVGGDYQDNALAEELERTFAAEVIAEAYLKHARDRAGKLRKGIAFWPLVETAYHSAKVFNEAGIPSEVIHGELPKPERRAMLQRLHTGQTLVVHGVNVLTEGFDEPTVDVVIPSSTRSAPRYQQQVGRVLRPNLELRPEQREKALIFDVVGVSTEHDLRSLIDLSPERPLRRDADEELSLLELEDELLELEEVRAGAAVTLQEEVYAGETEVRDFDPLGRSKVWQQTPGGTYFMSAGSAGYVFLTPSLAGEPAHWDIAMCSQNARPYRTRDGEVVEAWMRGTGQVDLPLDEAINYGEEQAEILGGYGAKSLVSKKSAWRKDEPSPSQKSWATRLGIALVHPDGTPMTKGEVSNLRDAMNAAQRIDPLVATVRAAYSE